MDPGLDRISIRVPPSPVTRRWDRRVRPERLGPHDRHLRPVGIRCRRGRGPGRREQRALQPDRRQVQRGGRCRAGLHAGCGESVPGTGGDRSRQLSGAALRPANLRERRLAGRIGATELAQCRMRRSPQPLRRHRLRPARALGRLRLQRSGLDDAGPASPSRATPTRGRPSAGRTAHELAADYAAAVAAGARLHAGRFRPVPGRA